MAERLVAGSAAAGEAHVGFDDFGAIVAGAAGDAERGELYFLFRDGLLRPPLVADGGSMIDSRAHLEGVGKVASVQTIQSELDTLCQ